MENEGPSYYITENCEVYDRFTFDVLFRRLLADGYDHEGAKDMILYHCALSALTFQERIDNRYYLKLRQDDPIAEDLLEFKRETLSQILNRPN